MRIKNLLPLGLYTKPQKLLLSLLLGLVLSTFFVPKVQGQIYVASKDKLAYYNVATNTWVAKTGMGVGTSSLTVTSLSPIAMANGKRNLYMHGFITSNTTNFFSFGYYSPETDNWTFPIVNETLTYTTSGNMVITNSSPKRMYVTGEISTGITLKYRELTSNGDLTGTGPATGIMENFTNMVYDDANYIYKSVGTEFKRYEYMTNTLTTMAAIPTNSAGMLAYTNLGTSGKIFALGVTSTKFQLSEYDVATNTWTALSNCPSGNGTGLRIVWDGANALYVLRNSDGAFWKYDITTATWTTLPSENINGASAHDAFGYYLPKCEPVGTLTSTMPTCTASGVALSDASITLTTYDSWTVKVGYSAGTTYTGPAFASATPVTAAPMLLSNTLPNPPTDQIYTVRLYCATGEYTDSQVTVRHRDCNIKRVYIFGNPSTATTSIGAFYDINTNTWSVVKAPPYDLILGLGANDGADIYAYAPGVGSDPYVFKYNTSADVWTEKVQLSTAGADNSVNPRGSVAIVDPTNPTTAWVSYPDVNYVTRNYSVDLTTNTATALPSITNIYTNGLLVGNKIYDLSGGKIYNYPAMTLASTFTTTIPGATGHGVYNSTNNKIYKVQSILSGSTITGYTMKSWDLTTQTVTTLASTTGKVGFCRLMWDGGDNIYAVTTSPSGTDDNMLLYKYSISADTWVLQSTFVVPATKKVATTWAFATLLRVVTPPVSCTITATAAAKQNTCSSNADATITLTAHSGATKVAYSLGSTFTGTYAGALDIMPAPFTIANKLPNPAAAQAYTIRLYCDETNFIDQTVTLQPKSVGCN